MSSSRFVKSEWASSPTLKYPKSIFIWRRGSSLIVSSFHWQFRQKLMLFFHQFEENWHGQIRNGQSNRILKWYCAQTGHWLGTKSQNRRQTSNSLLWCPPTSQSEQRKVDTSTFWKCSKQIFSKTDEPQKYWKKWTLLFLSGRPWFKIVFSFRFGLIT